MAFFHEVASVAEQAAQTASRLQKRAAIAEGLSQVRASSLEDAGRFALYLAGQPFAEADPRKLNAGGALVTKLVREVSSASDAALTAAYRRHGDLGAAAFDLLNAKAPSAPSLTLAEVEQTFATMATAKTTAVRASTAEAMLRRATALEAKYLVKLMLGDMRIGVQQSLVEEAIAVAAGGDVAAVRHAVMLEADLARAVHRAFDGTLAEARMALFHPLGFMLASPVETPEEAIERFTTKPVVVKKPIRSKRKKNTEELEAQFEAEKEDRTETEKAAEVEAFLEDKYDGMRAQVHCGDTAQPGRVAIYSRNREDITESFPDLAEAFAGVSQPLILDGEILGWDFATQQALPFAVLGQRIGRKKVSNHWRKQVPVVFMAFDVMYAGDELLLPLPLRERRVRLENLLHRLQKQAVSPLEIDERAGGLQTVLFREAEREGVPRLLLSPSRLVASAEEIDRAYADARARANEGVMLKAAGSAYLPGRRGLAWVKLKRELATLDVVITGAEFGHGKRAGLLSDYTFAVRAPDGNLLNVGKAYSGVTDAEIAELTEWLTAHTLEDHGHFRTVEPLRVLEVAFNNIMRSTRHASGFALRFPRILKIRDDKPVSEIDTLERVEEIYQSQVDKPVEPPQE